VGKGMARSVDASEGSFDIIDQGAKGEYLTGPRPEIYIVIGAI